MRVNNFTMTYMLFILLLILGSYVDSPLVAVDNIHTDTEYLSSDLLKGRGTGSEDILVAAEYIAQRFEESGLMPSFGTSFFQHVTIPDQSQQERNVIGIIPSKYPTYKSLIFMAHYDGLGVKVNEGLDDSIYNAALDNAVGVAALIELARQLAMDKEVINHNLVFMATAAEEVGLHGSKYYIENPIFPLVEISLCLNIDGFNVSGPRQDYFIMPRQGIDFVPLIDSLVSKDGWIYNPPSWVDGMNTLFDTAPFLAYGIPAITLWTGNLDKDGQEVNPPKFGPIHSPDDEINEHWNWEGVDDHLDLYLSIARFVMKNGVSLHVTEPSMFETIE